MKGTFWLIRKTIFTTFTNHKNLLLFLLFPVVGILLAMLIHGGAEDKTIHIGIVNQDSGQVITENVIQFVDQIQNVQIREVTNPGSHGYILSGELDAVITFPVGFAQSLKGGDAKFVQLESMSGMPVAEYIKMLLHSYIDQIVKIGKMAQGLETFDALYAEYMEVDFRLSTMQIDDQFATNNMSKQSIGYLVIMMLFSAVSLSTIIIKEKENRTYHRLLSAPITSGMYVASNVVVNFIVMTLQIGVSLIVMTKLFHINPGIPIGLLFFVLLLFALVSIGLSLMLVAFSNSSMEATASQNMIIIPTSLLAGCMFPIETMPSFIQKIGNFLPQHWLLETIGELQHGNSLESVYLNMAILLAFALTFAIIAAYRFGRNGELRSYY